MNERRTNRYLPLHKASNFGSGQPRSQRLTRFVANSKAPAHTSMVVEVRADEHQTKKLFLVNASNAPFLERRSPNGGWARIQPEFLTRAGKSARAKTLREIGDQ